MPERTSTNQSHITEIAGEELCPGTKHTGPFTVTTGFLTAWRASGLDPETLLRLLAVMHGITREPRHPAYRVAETTDTNVYESTVSATPPNRLRFYADPLGNRPLWLEVH